MEHLPNVTLSPMTGIGHIPMEEAPRRSANDLRRWLAGAAEQVPIAEPGRRSPF